MSLRALFYFNFFD